jgi:hypothetical protein
MEDLSGRQIRRCFIAFEEHDAPTRALWIVIYSASPQPAARRLPEGLGDGV